ncbi:MAG TPA: nuclear transport factor 2 family protein [Pyrinomonadaceae bacterium]|nr:nuclear transport factor 2 family protein [Pyrinomonadaceae bacterium]
MVSDTQLETPSDEQTLTRLNQEYVDAFMNADVEWYREHLADEFVVIESDGSLLNKEQFLRNTVKGPDVADYKLHEVDIRIYGSAALVRATGVWTRRNGSMGMSRYTDVYVRQNDGWKTVSAQITRTSRMGPRGRYKRAK